LLSEKTCPMKGGGELDRKRTDKEESAEFQALSGKKGDEWKNHEFKGGSRRVSKEAVKKKKRGKTPTILS